MCSWGRVTPGPCWRSTPPALTSCPSLMSCSMTLVNPTRGLASRLVPCVSLVRHAPSPAEGQGQTVCTDAHLDPTAAPPTKQLLFPVTLRSLRKPRTVLEAPACGPNLGQNRLTLTLWHQQKDFWCCSGQQCTFSSLRICWSQLHPPLPPSSFDPAGSALNSTTEELLCTNHSRCYDRCVLLNCN